VSDSVLNFQLQKQFACRERNVDSSS